MGQAKRRGTYEFRVEQAQLAQQIVEKAFTDTAKRLKILRHYDNNVRALANAVIEKQKDEQHKSASVH